MDLVSEINAYILLYYNQLNSTAYSKQYKVIN